MKLTTSKNHAYFVILSLSFGVLALMPWNTQFQDFMLFNAWKGVEISTLINQFPTD